MARLFVAIDFPDNIISGLKRCQPASRRGIRLSSPEQLHLTLHFLGDAETDRISAALRFLRMEPISVTISGVGTFTAGNQTSILWAGIEENASLRTLHQRVAELLAVEGYHPESRPFHPHITLARCQPGVPPSVIDAFLTDHKDLWFPDIGVHEVTLYSSTLTHHGAQYQRELTVSLTSGSP